MLATQKLATWVKDPQMWITFIAVVTLLGFCVGAFEAPETSKNNPHNNPQSMHWIKATPSEELAAADFEPQNQ